MPSENRHVSGGWITIKNALHPDGKQASSGVGLQAKVSQWSTGIYDSHHQKK
jgi:hypothetical protein